MAGLDRPRRLDGVRLRQLRDVLRDLIEREAVLCELRLVDPDLGGAHLLHDGNVVGVRVELLLDVGGELVDADQERAAHRGGELVPVVRGQHHHPATAPDLLIQEVHQLSERHVLVRDSVPHLEAVEAEEVPDRVDRLVVEVEEVGNAVLPEPLALDDLLDDPGLVRRPRGRIESVVHLHDVVVPPHPVGRPVLSKQQEFHGRL